MRRVMWVAMVVVFMPAMAMAAAAAPAQQEWWQSLLVQVITATVAVLTPVLGVLLTLLIRRWGISVQQDQIELIVGQAVAFAEQMAKKALRNGAEKTGSAEKMDTALTIAAALMRQFKVAQMARDKLTALIEAKLGEEVLP